MTQNGGVLEQSRDTVATATEHVIVGEGCTGDIAKQEVQVCYHLYDWESLEHTIYCCVMLARPTRPCRLVNTSMTALCEGTYTTALSALHSTSVEIGPLNQALVT